MTDFFAALALAIVIEGLIYGAFPEQMKRALAQLQTLPASTIRAVALACAAAGLVLLWFIRG
ncbi:MAG TPA: DUF2065 domain-containing protein [Alphaproteobacteria bacterium]|nr:DUF2065 domain-containing protein [Alphaproteobacteria bacterium]